MPSPSDYTHGAACRRGHWASFNVSTGSPAPRCPECGAEVLTGCPNCGMRLRGVLIGGVIGAHGSPPQNFCDKCGGPYPWVDRRGRLWQLENLLDDENISEADRLTVGEQLQALRGGDSVPEEEQRERWQRVKQLAPGLMESGKAIVVTVVSATIQRQLGI